MPPHSLILQARDAFQRGDLAAAESAVLRAPDSLDAREIRILIARQRGRLDEARALLSAIADTPGAPDWAFEDLAGLLHETGDREGALAAAERGAAASPLNPQLRFLAGSMLSEMGGLIEGEAHLRRAVALAGPHPQLLANLALNLLTQGRLDEADALYRQIEAARALDAAALAGWARLKEARGEFDAAGALLDRAAALGADVRLSRAVLLNRRGKPAEALALIEAAGEAIGPDARLERGRLREALGRHGEAWSDYITAKAGFRAPPYDAAAVEALFARLKGAFDRELPAATVRSDLPQPVFILGFPRSGTTLIEQVLSSHSAVRAGGELPFLADLRAVAGDPPDLTEKTAQALRDAYLDRARACGLLEPGARWFTDKMPLNEVWLPLLRMAFPASPVIRLRRHPLDVMVSMLSHHLTHGFGCGYRPADIAHQLQAVHALSEAHAARLPLTTLRYEDFVADQEGETHRLLALVDLELEPACLAFHQSRRHAPTPSYAQVTQPLNDRSIGRWRRHEVALAPYAAQLAGLMADQGYA